MLSWQKNLIIMACYIINNQPIFLSRKRYLAVKSEATAGKDLTYRIGAMIKGHPEQKEVDDRIETILKQKFAESPTEFQKNWVELDLRDEEARENVWDLLYLWCQYRGYARLVDLRSDIDRVLADYLESAWINPMGTIFALDHWIRPPSLWARLRYRMKGRLVRIIITLAAVKRIQGTLDDFYLFMNSLVIRCGSSIELWPHGGRLSDEALPGKPPAP